jgi:hypothetical protein
MFIAACSRGSFPSTTRSAPWCLWDISTSMGVGRPA